MCVTNVVRNTQEGNALLLQPKSLTEEPFGKDKWCIIRNSDGSFLGTRPNGEQRNLEKGGVENGPTILPASHSLRNLALVISGYACLEGQTLGCLFAGSYILILQPQRCGWWRVFVAVSYLLMDFYIYRCVVFLLHLILLNLPQLWPDLSNTAVCFNSLVLMYVTGNSSEARAKSWPCLSPALI